MTKPNEMFEKVLAFHRKHGHAAPDKFTPMSRKLAKFRLELILEELGEFADALGFAVEYERDYGAPALIGIPSQNDDTASVDGITDLLYVVIGTCIAMGIRDPRFFDEIHRSNMTKPVKSKGWLSKPDKDGAYDPPNLERVLKEMKDE